MAKPNRPPKPARVSQGIDVKSASGREAAAQHWARPGQYNPSSTFADLRQQVDLPPAYGGIPEGYQLPGYAGAMDDLKISLSPEETLLAQNLIRALESQSAQYPVGPRHPLYSLYEALTTPGGNWNDLLDSRKGGRGVPDATETVWDALLSVANQGTPEQRSLVKYLLQEGVWRGDAQSLPAPWPSRIPVSEDMSRPQAERWRNAALSDFVAKLNREAPQEITRDELLGEFAPGGSRVQSADDSALAAGDALADPADSGAAVRQFIGDEDVRKRATLAMSGSPEVAVGGPVPNPYAGAAASRLTSPDLRAPRVPRAAEGAAPPATDRNLRAVPRALTALKDVGVVTGREPGYPGRMPSRNTLLDVDLSLPDREQMNAILDAVYRLGAKGGPEAVDRALNKHYYLSVLADRAHDMALGNQKALANQLGPLPPEGTPPGGTPPNIDAGNVADLPDGDLDPGPVELNPFDGSESAEPVWSSVVRGTRKTPLAPELESLAQAYRQLIYADAVPGMTADETAAAQLLREWYGDDDTMLMNDLFGAPGHPSLDQRVADMSRSPIDRTTVAWSGMGESLPDALAAVAPLVNDPGEYGRRLRFAGATAENIKQLQDWAFTLRRLTSSQLKDGGKLDQWDNPPDRVMRMGSEDDRRVQDVLAAADGNILAAQRLVEGNRKLFRGGASDEIAVAAAQTAGAAGDPIPAGGSNPFLGVFSSPRDFASRIVRQAQIAGAPEYQASLADAVASTLQQAYPHQIYAPPSDALLGPAGVNPFGNFRFDERKGVVRQMFDNAERRKMMMDLRDKMGIRPTALPELPPREPYTGGPERMEIAPFPDSQLPGLASHSGDPRTTGVAYTDDELIGARTKNFPQVEPYRFPEEQPTPGLPPAAVRELEPVALIEEREAARRVAVLREMVARGMALPDGVINNLAAPGVKDELQATLRLPHPAAPQLESGVVDDYMNEMQKLLEDRNNTYAKQKQQREAELQRMRGLQ